MSFPGLQPGLLSTPAELNFRKGTDDKVIRLTLDCVFYRLFSLNRDSLLRSFSQPCSRLNQGQTWGQQRKQWGDPWRVGFLSGRLCQGCALCCGLSRALGALCVALH